MASAAAALSVGLRTLFSCAQTSDMAFRSSSGRSFSSISAVGSSIRRRLAEGCSSPPVVVVADGSAAVLARIRKEMNR